MEGDLQRRVGENIRAYREARGISQKAFADLLGFHRTYMGGVERGRAQPDARAWNGSPSGP